MAETLSEGVVIPQGSDTIKASGVDWGRTLGSTANAALSTKASTAYVDAKAATLAARAYYRGTALAGTNFDLWLSSEWNGLWTFSALGAATMTGLPEGFGDKPGSMVHSGADSRVATQTYYPYGAYSTIPMTRSLLTVTTNEWSEWAPVGAGSSMGPMTQHSIRQAQMVQAYGRVDTGGLGAVALRFDHGLTNFRDKVLPALRSRGIKCAQAYNPRNWHRDENAGVTATDLNGWVAAGDVEIMNHSANHLGADTRDALYDQIVNGLAEIESQLPAAAGKVWGFAPPGVSSGNYGGFNDGRTPEGWDTYAGQLILQRHAVGTGYLPGTASRVLDGVLRDGLGHVTMDARTVASIKADIDAAIASRQGIQFMLHPSNLDVSGYLTTAQFVEVLDYIVLKRDAGEIVSLSPYEMLLADSTGGAGVDVDAALAAYQAAIA